MRTCSLVTTPPNPSDDHHTMVRTIQLNRPINLVNEIKPVLRQKRQDGIEALLQVALGENQAVERGSIGASAIVAAHCFASCLGLDLRHLILDLALTAVER